MFTGMLHAGQYAVSILSRVLALHISEELRYLAQIRRYSSQYSARLSAHPNGLVVNLMEQPDNKTPAK
jgi:hypothetical protein